MKRKTETIAIREGLQQTPHQEHSVPLFLTSSFTFNNIEEGTQLFKGEKNGNIYSRFSNPNTSDFIHRLKVLEQCEAGVATASGMAAVYVCLSAHLASGDRIVSSKNIFGNSHRIIAEILAARNVTCDFVEVDDNQAWEEALSKKAKVVFLESPSNPTLQVADLAYISKLCKPHDALLIVDNTFATAYLQRPKQHGADIVIHSATKYIDGQGRVLGGAILGDEAHIAPCYNYIRVTGASLSPFNAWVLSKSLETLPIRMDRHCSNALKLAEFLEQDDHFESVIYPHLPSHPQYHLAKKYMDQGGGLVSCNYRGSVEELTTFLNGLKLQSLTANLGDVKSIVTHPSSTTHSKLSKEEQLAAGITEKYIRFSVGLENIDDILEDIQQALNKIH